jgi:hypothetical protein
MLAIEFSLNVQLLGPSASKAGDARLVRWGSLGTSSAKGKFEE